MEQKIRRDRNMGENLRRLRREKHISQETLCAELQRRGCDIGRTTYAKYESGELNIRASVLIELRKFYGCPYDAFFAGLEEETDWEKCPPQRYAGTIKKSGRPCLRGGRSAFLCGFCRAYPIMPLAAMAATACSMRCTGIVSAKRT